MTFEEAVSVFNQHLTAHGRSGKTRYGYCRDVRQLQVLLERLRNRPLQVEEIEARDIELFVRYLHEERGLQPRSINRILHALASFYNFAKIYGLLEVNPMVRIPRMSFEKKERLFLTEEQLTAFLSGVEDALRSTVYYMLAYTGLRVSELTGLRVCDVNLLEGTILVRGKGRKNRTVPVHPLLKEKLLRYTEEREGSKSDYGSFFHTDETMTLSPSTVNRWIKQRLASLDWKQRITAHTFRHTFGYMYIAHGGNVVELQHLMGHESLIVTSVYSHTSRQRVTEGITRLPSM